MYQNITICLDLTDKDQTLIDFAIYLRKLYAPKSLTLLHAAHLSYLPEKIRQKYMTDIAVAKLKTRIRAEIACKVDALRDFSPHIKILDGHPRTEISEWIDRHGTDLVVIGKGNEAHESCALARQLARNSEASVMIIPQGSKAVFKSLLCPTDFTKDAENALIAACKIGQVAGARHLEIFHLYYPPIYQYDSELELDYQFEWSYSGFERDIADYSQNQLENLKERAVVARSGMQVSTVLEGGTDIPLAIEERAEKREADLCVIGQCDRSPINAFLLGSTAEKLIQVLRVPLLVVGHIESLAHYVEVPRAGATASVQATQLP